MKRLFLAFILLFNLAYSHRNNAFEQVGDVLTLMPAFVGVISLVSKRPCCNDWKGMPSGHSGGGFSAAAFVYYRYGWKAAIAPIILATLTAASRVQARKHTLWQVAAGGAIAWAYGWLVTTKYHPKNFSITPDISINPLGGMEFSAQAYYRF